jgi:phosphatidate cytidylyltransferase
VVLALGAAAAILGRRIGLRTEPAPEQVRMSAPLNEEAGGRPGAYIRQAGEPDDVENPRRGDLVRSTQAAGSHPDLNLAFGVPYIGLAAVTLPWLRADPVAGFANTLFMLAVVWGSDIGAYLCGRLLGGPKLAPAISPGKTWSGALGGLGCAALVGLVAAACLSSEFSPSHAIGAGIAFGIISQMGDLFESALKRHFGVKDSGRIIPGHGGLLDRVDALLVVAPAAALLAFTVGRGVVLWR